MNKKNNQDLDKSEESNFVEKKNQESHKHLILQR